jgi:hypothetical protein
LLFVLSVKHHIIYRELIIYSTSSAIIATKFYLRLYLWSHLSEIGVSDGKNCYLEKGSILKVWKLKNLNLILNANSISYDLSPLFKNARVVDKSQNHDFLNVTKIVGSFHVFIYGLELCYLFKSNTYLILFEIIWIPLLLIKYTYVYFPVILYLTAFFYLTKEVLKILY